MSAIDLSPGALFAGQFRVVRPLAKGGMGAVYVVEQVATGRERALKLMHPALVSDEKSIERFEREARIGSRIASEHIVEVIAAGVEREGPTPWLAMELLSGETLDERVSRGGPPPRTETVQILRQLAHALTAAHRAGIVHRDLKPENLFLAESRREGVPFTLKILDFGIATLQEANASGVEVAKTTQAVGSPLWMAPEQTQVGKVTPATDVWALGLITFYLLTGATYWRTLRSGGSGLTALLVEILVDPLESAGERARELGRGDALPPGFDAWFAMAVAREPTRRFRDASAAFEPLFALLEGRSASIEAFAATTASPSGPPSVSSSQPATRALKPRDAPEAKSAEASTPAPKREAAAEERAGAGARRALPWALLALALIVSSAGVAWLTRGARDAPAPDATSPSEERASALDVMAPIGATPRADPPDEPSSASPPGAPDEPSARDAVEPTRSDEPAAPPEGPSAGEAGDAHGAAADAPARDRPRPRAPRSTVTPEQFATFERMVIQRCRSNLDGAPRTRFTVVIDGAVRVSPAGSQAEQWFGRCVRMLSTESRQPSGTYVFSAP